jgi:hypothetical protein
VGDGAGRGVEVAMGEGARVGGRVGEGKGVNVGDGVEDASISVGVRVEMRAVAA